MGEPLTSGMLRARRAAATLAGCLYLPACFARIAADNGDADATGTAEPGRVVVGDDGRRELYELEPDTLRERIAASTAALMWPEHLRYVEGGAVELDAPPLEASGVCESERFAQQPSAAFCSAVLVDRNLVLTAGHCLGNDLAAATDACGRLRIVFDYHLLEGDKLALSSSQSVYACRRVAHHEHRHQQDDFIDLAVLELDRVAGNRVPIEISQRPLEIGDRLLLATHGAGLPLKVESDATVLHADVAKNSFVTASDTFSGGSGAPLFDASLTLVGHQVRGAVDWEWEDGCMRGTHVPEEEGNEQHQRIETSVRRLCEGGLRSERLCGIASLASSRDGAGNATHPPAHCGAAAGRKHAAPAWVALLMLVLGGVRRHRGRELAERPNAWCAAASLGESREM